MARNQDYWKRRFEAMEDSQYQKSQEYYETVKEQFRQAQNDIQMDMERWYDRLAKNNDVSLAGAKKLLKKNELKEFQWNVNQYIKAGEENAVDQRWMKELENASAKYHVNYLQAMKMQMQQHVEKLFTEYEGGTTEFLHKTFGDQYKHTAYEIAKGTGVGSNLTQLDTRKIDALIKKPWAADGANFSDRIWANKQKLTNTLNTELTQSIIRGDDPAKAIRNLSQTMEVSRSQAGRLVMTESAAVSAAAQKECFQELDVERYEIVATLDSHTSEICRGLDGKVFQMSEYEVGVTAPPFHPWCRTTTVPYFDDEFTESAMRAARDSSGKTYFVPSDINYSTWSEKYFQKGLSAGDNVNEGIPEHKKPIKLGEVDFSDKNMVLSKMKEYENTIVDSPIENAIVVSKDGTITQCFGDLNGVYPNIDLGEKFIGACVTHNHPVGSVNEYSFSNADINLFMDNDLEILRGIDEKYIYELSRVQADADEHMGIFDLEEEFDSRHEMVIGIARQYGLGYRRWKRER